MEGSRDAKRSTGCSGAPAAPLKVEDEGQDPTKPKFLVLTLGEKAVTDGANSSPTRPNAQDRGAPVTVAEGRPEVGGEEMNLQPLPRGIVIVVTFTCGAALLLRWLVSLYCRGARGGSAAFSRCVEQVDVDKMRTIAGRRSKGRSRTTGCCCWRSSPAARIVAGRNFRYSSRPCKLWLT